MLLLTLMPLRAAMPLLRGRLIRYDAMLILAVTPLPIFRLPPFSLIRPRHCYFRRRLPLIDATPTPIFIPRH